MASKRVVALIRVSTDDQSLRAQRDQVESYARAQGMEIAEWFEEEGVSGAALARPVLDRLLAAARRDSIGTLVVPALDRVARDVARLVVTLDELQSHGVRLVSIREGLDFGGPMGRAMAALLGAVAEIERACIRDRIRAGMQAAKRRGARVGRPSLEWRPAEIAELRQLLAAGHSIREIRRTGTFKVFDKNGVPQVPSERAMSRVLKQSTQTQESDR
jgi:DNA invertase Pin-like site-specific DNA recombinase